MMNLIDKNSIVMLNNLFDNGGVEYLSKESIDQILISLINYVINFDISDDKKNLDDIKLVLNLIIKLLHKYPHLINEISLEFIQKILNFYPTNEIFSIQLKFVEFLIPTLSNRYPCFSFDDITNLCIHYSEFVFNTINFDCSESLSPFIEFMKYYFSVIKLQNRKDVLINILFLNEPLVKLVDKISKKFSDGFKKMFPIFKSIFIEIFIAKYQSSTSSDKNLKIINNLNSTKKLKTEANSDTVKDDELLNFLGSSINNKFRNIYIESAMIIFKKNLIDEPQLLAFLKKLIFDFEIIDISSLYELIKTIDGSKLFSIINKQPYNKELKFKFHKIFDFVSLKIQKFQQESTFIFSKSIFYLYEYMLDKSKLLNKILKVDFDIAKPLIKEIVREFDHQKNIMFLLVKISKISSKFSKYQTFTYFLHCLSSSISKDEKLILSSITLIKNVKKKKIFLQLIKVSIWRYNFYLSQHNIHNNEIEFINELINSIQASKIHLIHRTQKLILDTLYRELVLFYHCNMNPNQNFNYSPELFSYEEISKLINGKVTKKQMYYLLINSFISINLKKLYIDMPCYEKIFLNTIELVYQQSVNIACTHSNVPIKPKICCLLSFSIKYFLQSLPIFSIQSYKHASKIFIRTIEIISESMNFDSKSFKNTCYSLRNFQHCDLLKQMHKQIQKKIKSSFPSNLFENAALIDIPDDYKKLKNNFCLFIIKIIFWTEFKSEAAIKYALLNCISSLKKESYNNQLLKISIRYIQQSLVWFCQNSSKKYTITNFMLSIFSFIDYRNINADDIKLITRLTKIIAENNCIDIFSDTCLKLIQPNNLFIFIQIIYHNANSSHILNDNFLKNLSIFNLQNFYKHDQVSFKYGLSIACILFENELSLLLDIVSESVNVCTNLKDLELPVIEICFKCLFKYTTIINKCNEETSSKIFTNIINSFPHLLLNVKFNKFYEKCSVEHVKKFQKAIFRKIKSDCRNSDKKELDFKIMKPIIDSFKYSQVSENLIKMSSNFIKNFHPFFNDDLMFVLTEKTIFNATKFRNLNSSYIIDLLYYHTKIIDQKSLFSIFQVLKQFYYSYTKTFLKNTHIILLVWSRIFLSIKLEDTSMIDDYMKFIKTLIANREFKKYSWLYLLCYFLTWNNFNKEKKDAFKNGLNTLFNATNKSHYAKIRSVLDSSQLEVFDQLQYKIKYK